MKTIILCGGKGYRMKEETEYKPKPMVMVGDKPILWHIMKIYAHHGFNDFILALGYKADFIKDYFLNQKAFTSDFTLNTLSHRTQFYLSNRKEFDDFSITFVDTGVETLVGERILRCREYIPKRDTHFMVTYGDGVADIDIGALVRFHRRQKTVGTITGVHPRSKYGLVKADTDGKVRGITEKPVLRDWVNGGFMVFTKEVFSYLSPGEMEHAALSDLAKKHELSLYTHDGFWYAVDTYRELKGLNALWSSDHPPWRVWKR